MTSFSKQIKEVTLSQADAFNAVFGITTNFASVTPIDDQGRVVGSTGSGASNNAANGASSSAADTAVASTTAAAAPAASTTAAASNTGSGGNLQTFTGTLGATAPTVTALGDGRFQVTGNSAFNNLQNALVRSWYVHPLTLDQLRLY